MGNTGGRARGRGRGRGSKLPDDKLKDPEPVRVAITPREPTEVRDNITDIVIFYCRPCARGEARAHVAVFIKPGARLVS